MKKNVIHKMRSGMMLLLTLFAFHFSLSTPARTNQQPKTTTCSMVRWFQISW